MTTYYRNVGAPIPREHGGPMVPTGEVFEPTPRELMMWGYKLNAVVAHDAAPLMATDPVLEAVEPNDATHTWPMALAAEKYLAIFPDGEHADLARRLLAPDDTTPDAG